MREKALRLRLEGNTYDEIGDVLGITRKNAHKHVQNALRELRAVGQEKAEELRQMDGLLIDRLIRAILPTALKPEPIIEVVDGKAIEVGVDREMQFKAIDRLNKLLERKAALFGYDAPQRAELSGPDGAPIETSVEHRLTSDYLATLPTEQLLALERADREMRAAVDALPLVPQLPAELDEDAEDPAEDEDEAGARDVGGAARGTPSLAGVRPHEPALPQRSGVAEHCERDRAPAPGRGGIDERGRVRGVSASAVASAMRSVPSTSLHPEMLQPLPWWPTTWAMGVWVSPSIIRELADPAGIA